MMVLPLRYAAFLLPLLLNGAVSQSCSLDPDGKATDTVEVLVLGGGMSGIAAARTLEVNDISDFVVLEAFDRIGGRIREDPDTGLQLGANWIHGLDLADRERHPIWREWIRCDAAGPGGSTTPYVTSAFADDGAEIPIGEYDEVMERFSEACEAVADEADTLGSDVSMREALTDQNWVPSSPLENAVEWHLIDFCAADRPEDLQVGLFYTDYEAFEGTEEDSEAVDYLVVDDKGFSFVVRCLAEDFMDRVKLNTVITVVETAKDCVCATVEGGDRYCGSYAILTFSIGALQASVRGDSDAVRFDPPLPTDKQDAINSVTSVFYSKVFLTFDTPFWIETDEDQQILGYISNTRGYYPYFILDKNRPNIITADIADDLSLKVEDQPVSTTEDEIMTILRKIYGNDIPSPRSVQVSNWSNDPFFYGVWVAFDVGVQSDIFDRLLTPVDRLYFAGEALNSTQNGFTHGAYGSGVNVAKKIVDQIDKCKFTVIHALQEVYYKAHSIIYFDMGLYPITVIAEWYYRYEPTPTPTQTNKHSFILLTQQPVNIMQSC